MPKGLHPRGGERKALSLTYAQFTDARNLALDPE